MRNELQALDPVKDEYRRLQKIYLGKDYASKPETFLNFDFNFLVLFFIALLFGAGLNRDLDNSSYVDSARNLFYGGRLNR